MKAASRLADCLLKDLSQFDIPLSSDCAELAHFAATYLWYGCCGGGSPTAQDGIGTDLCQKDCVLFRCCCQYFELLLLGRKEASDIPKQLAVVLKSFKKPLTSAQWKAVIAGIRTVIQSIISCSAATPVAEKDRRWSLACCLTESVTVFVSFLISFQNREVAESTVQDLLSSLKSSALSDVLRQSDLSGLKLIGGVLLTFAKLTGSVKYSKEPNSFSQEIVNKCLSSLTVAVEEFKPSFGKIQRVTARVVVECVECLITLLLGNKGGDILSAEGLQLAVSLYTRLLELCESVLPHHSHLPRDDVQLCQILCLKRDVWFRKFKLINIHLQKDSNCISGVYFGSYFDFKIFQNANIIDN